MTLFLFYFDIKSAKIFLLDEQQHIFYTKSRQFKDITKYYRNILCI